MIASQVDPVSAQESVVIDGAPTEDTAVARLEQYRGMSSQDRSAITVLPPLAVWNAMIIRNPLLGKINAFNLNYNLTKSLNEFPYAGAVFTGVKDPSEEGKQIVTIEMDDQQPYYNSIPFFRFTISASQLNARPGGQITINIKNAYDAQGHSVDTSSESQQYTIQRISAVEAVVGVMIPYRTIATRTLPVLLVFGGNDQAATPVRTVTIEFTGLDGSEVVNVTVPGYATTELREVSEMYNLPAGDIR